MAFLPNCRAWGLPRVTAGLGALVIFFVLVVLLPKPASAFGEQGAFDPRILMAGGTTQAAYPTAPARWSVELMSRTSAHARSRPTLVRASDPSLVDAPFVYWSGRDSLTALTTSEISGLRRFFALGGTMLVDDAAASAEGDPGAFGRAAKREIARVLPDTAPISLGKEHVLFRSFYLLNRAEGRVQGRKHVEAIVRNGQAQVIFLENDLGGALARGATGLWEHSPMPGGETQREQAVRLAVNVSMYVLCSDYKDDQVHAPFLMRRRTRIVEP